MGIGAIGIDRSASIKHFVSGKISVSSGTLRLETYPRLGSLRPIIVSLLMVVATGCSNGEGYGQAPTEILSQHETPSSGDGQASSIIIPQHDAPLGTDRGGEYFAGRLILSEGCLRVEVPSEDAANPRSSPLLIWPSSFTLQEESGTVRVIDGLGQTAAHVGDHIRLSRAAVTYQQARDRGLVKGLSEDCAEPFLLVGDEVTIYDPKNEATELRLSDPDVVFLRQKTVVASHHVLQAAMGIGRLVLDGQCLRLKDSSTTII